MNEIAIEAKRLTRYFGQSAIVNEVSFALPTGSVTGLLGLNGAGKSSTIRMLMGLLAPTRGSCSVLGIDSSQLTAADRSRIGYTIEGHYLYSSMSVRQLEELQKGSFARWNSTYFQSVIDRFGIQPHSVIRTLSRGQRAGVSIALTLSSEPELLILDDPSLGLDPVARRALNETLLEFVGRGDRTIFLSSHLLDDIERVTDRILIMIQGGIVVDSSLAGFLSRITAWTCRTSERIERSLRIPGLIDSHWTDDRLMMLIVDAGEQSHSAMQRLGGDTLERAHHSFDESVVAYMSRSRSWESFSSVLASGERTQVASARSFS
jgi:ABC-2 type transport system ATP-binding protein